MEIKRVYVDAQRLRIMRGILVNQGVYFMAGMNSFFVPSRRTKYLDEKAVTDWPDLQDNVKKFTPGEIARIELNREFPGIKKLGWRRPEFSLLDWRWPMVYSGPYLGELVYTDLVGAFHQLYSNLWLNVAFPFGYGSLDLSPVAKRLSKNKRARNSLIGITRSTTATARKGDRRITIKTKNPWLSPALWATIMALLNEIAHIALFTGAIYVATDGYIHPMKSDHKAFHMALESRGIYYRSHYGDGEIRGWGSYRTPERTTTVYKKRDTIYHGTIRNLALFDVSNPLAILDWYSWKVPNYRGLMGRIAKEREVTTND